MMHTDSILLTAPMFENLTNECRILSLSQLSEAH